MRKAIRFALPVVAAASALVLTGCGDDDAPFGVEGGGALGGVGGGGTPSEEDLEELEEMELPPPAEGGDTGGDTGGVTGGGGGTVPTVDQMQGMWYSGETGASETSTLQVSGSSVAWEEANGMEGDICTGSATDGAIAFDSCSQYGDSAWSSMAAAVSMDGSSLTMTFDDGSVFQYTMG
jgi:hypothetical protein